MPLSLLCLVGASAPAWAQSQSARDEESARPEAAEGRRADAPAPGTVEVDSRQPVSAPAGDKAPAAADAPASAANGNVDDGNQRAHGERPAGTPSTLDPQEGEDELTLDEWERDDWANARPRVALFDIAGYFRVRGDLLRRLDLGNDGTWEQIRGVPQARYPHARGQQAGYSQLSMRLRLEPRLHVSDALQVMSTVDVLDNLVFGSTPNTYPPVPSAERPPAHVLSTGQVVARRGFNSFNDTIAVKRLWARVGFLHDHLELKVGRMPDHWGLGFWINSGDCLNCDLGTMVDRVSVAFRALGHVFMPYMDWVSRGPLRLVFGQNDLTAVSAAPWAVTRAYGLRVSKEEHPDDIRDALAHGRTVTEYGLLNAIRQQSRDLPLSAYQAAGDSPLLRPLGTDDAALSGEKRDATLYQGDIFAKWYRNKVELGAELALQAGSFWDSIDDVDNVGNGAQKTRVLQVGGAAEALWHLREDRRGTRLSLKVGGASGDAHAGMGGREMADTQRGQNPISGTMDRKLTAFQFSPDYHIDLLLFRRMLGTVTDAAYLRPEVAYRFDDKFSGRLAAIYSQAMTARSTPSSDNGELSGSAPLGLEVDGELAYGLLTRDERGQLLASLAAGIFQPFAGMRSKPVDSTRFENGRFAWTLQARMFVTF